MIVETSFRRLNIIIYVSNTSIKSVYKTFQCFINTKYAVMSSR